MAISIAIIGASGAAGQEIIALLARRRFPYSELVLYATQRSAGNVVASEAGELTIQEYHRDQVARHDVIFAAVSGDFARAEALALASQARLVIDLSSAYRLHPDTPLIIPEINADMMGSARLIANPNCTTAILLMALAPIQRKYGLARVITATYQAASGAGAAGMTELRDQTEQFLATGTADQKIFPHPLAFNLIPHIDTFDEDGHTREEAKVVLETRKILNLPDLPISCTAVRIPTMRAHGIAATIELVEPASPTDIQAVLAEAAGVKLVDAPAQLRYPMPLTASGQESVEVGRVRRNPVFGHRGIDLFACGDQLWKGAALNAVQIAEIAVTAGTLRPAA